MHTVSAARPIGRPDGKAVGVAVFQLWQQVMSVWLPTVVTARPDGSTHHTTCAGGQNLIGWSNNHFNNLHFIIPLETSRCSWKPLIICVKYWNVGCWNDSQTSTWKLKRAAAACQLRRRGAREAGRRVERGWYLLAYRTYYACWTVDWSRQMGTSWRRRGT